MRVGQLSESDAVDALRLPFYSSSHPTGSHGWRNQFDLGNPDWYGMRDHLHKTKQKKKDDIQDFAKRYTRWFPNLRKEIEEFQSEEGLTLRTPISAGTTTCLRKRE